MSASEPQVPEGAPYFNFERRTCVIEGSRDIIPASPIEVGHVRQLVLDKHIVDTTWNCFRKVHQPDKHPDNPLIPGGSCEPEGYVAEANCGTVLYDEELGRFRFWTTRLDMTKGKWSGAFTHAYWESEDGIHWVKPELGIVEYDGSKANNILQAGKGELYGAVSVVELPSRLRSKGRFAMVYGFSQEAPRPGTYASMETRIAWSADGLHWEDEAGKPAIAGRNDTFVNMVYNPERDVFMQYRRATVNAHEIRRMAYSESRDLTSWTQPEVIIDPDELDGPMLYDFTVNRYESAYLGLLHTLYSPNAGYKTGSRIWKDGRTAKDLHVDVQLAWSRDGKHWERHPERPIFLETGIYATETKYDWRMVYV